MKHLFQVGRNETDAVHAIAKSIGINAFCAKEWDNRTDMYVFCLREEADKLMEALNKKGIITKIYTRIEYTS